MSGGHVENGEQRRAGDGLLADRYLHPTLVTIGRKQAELCGSFGSVMQKIAQRLSIGRPGNELSCQQLSRCRGKTSRDSIVRCGDAALRVDRQSRRRRTVDPDGCSQRSGHGLSFVPKAGCEI
jgi:hypothetical protein